MRSVYGWPQIQVAVESSSNKNNKKEKPITSMRLRQLNQIAGLVAVWNGSLMHPWAHKNPNIE